MRSPSAPAAAPPRDAESLFRTLKIPEIRSLESSTLREIEDKKEDLRQLVGRSYRDLISSADSISLMLSSAESISSNLHRIHSSLISLSSSASEPLASPHNPSRSRLYSIASRVKYLVDTPESIWGCLDESMLSEASGRYLRANVVHSLLSSSPDRRDSLSRFPLLRHQWQIVESFRPQISQRARDRLTDRGLPVSAYADALAAASVVDDLDPLRALTLFLDSRKSWISQIVVNSDRSDPAGSLCDVAGVVRATVGQVGELFLQALNERPMFYGTVLGLPPGTQLFGGVPNPEEEVRRWREHMERLESVMVGIEPEDLARYAVEWLKGCCREIFDGVKVGWRLVEGIDSGEALGNAEKLVREVLDSREGMEGSLEQWLKSVFGSEIESPWDQIRGMILKDGKDVFEDALEEAFVGRMKEIVDSGFEELSRDIDLEGIVSNVVADPAEGTDFESYMKAPSTGGVWFSETNHRKAAIGYGLKATIDENDFQNCLNGYLGSEVSRVKDVLDRKCKEILEDLLSFMESHNSLERLKVLAPFLQERCQKTMSLLLEDLNKLIGELSSSLDTGKGTNESQQSASLVKRALFIGRLLFAVRNHSSHIPLILGSPRQWVKDTNSALFGSLQTPMLKSPGPRSPRRQSFDSPGSPRRQFFDVPKRQIVSAAATLFSMDDNVKPKYDELSKKLRDLCIKAHSIWISWVSTELSKDLLAALDKDESLSSTTSLKGWEITVIKQGESADGPLEMKIELPSMPSLYITSFLFRACHEIHRIGGHVLDKQILQKFAWSLFDKVVSVYQSFLSTIENRKPQVSEKGILQILLDLRFCADVLSGGKDSTSGGLDSDGKEGSAKPALLKSTFRRKQSQFHIDSAMTERVMRLVQILSQKLDPIDWAIYESYLWDNEKQSYKRYSVLYGFLIQLNRLHMDTVQKLPTKSNTESNILRCSTVPRFKYLPISAPALSSRGTHKASHLTGPDDKSARNTWKGVSNSDRSPKSDIDDNQSFGVTTPLFKSFMTQVGSKFGESTSRLGSMLTDAQVGMLRDRSAAAMSTFGDMLPGPAAGLLSSLTAGAARSDI